MQCKICNSESNKLLIGTLLNNYEVQYYQCNSCKFIQTEEPYWLEEAYNEPIPDVDVGYVTRNIYYGERVAGIIRKYFNAEGKFIDYGGGYGMFARLMRDMGLEFYRQDSYCENFFAAHFDITNLPEETKYELLTAFEVFEHLVNPMKEIEDMFEYSDSILFSTNLQPNHPLSKTDDWWYFSVEKGQHVALFHLETLNFIKDHFNCHLYTNGETFHLLSKKKLNGNPIKYALKKYGLIDRVFKRNFYSKGSLIQKDFEFVKQIHLKQGKTTV
ncbi:MAG: class I SAM-dependent methyltransferase [Crocinitomicaceae bacterium]